MKNIINKMRVKIVIALALSLFFSGFIKKELFISNTPYLKQPLNEYFAMKIRDLNSSTSGIVASLFNKKTSTGKIASYGQFTKNNMAKVDSQPLIKLGIGVYAQNKENVTRITIKKDEIEWVEYTFTLNNKPLKIRIPKGSQPPTQDVLEKIYK